MRKRELVLAYPLFDGISDHFVLMGQRLKDPWKGLYSGFGGNVEKENECARKR